MFKLVVLSLAVVCIQAGGLGLEAGAGLGLAAGAGLGLAAGTDLGLAAGGVAHGADLGFGAGLGGLAATTYAANGLVNGGLGVGKGLSYGGALGPIPAAINSVRTYEVRPVALPQEPPILQTIDVEPSEQPVQVVFRSISSPVLVQQVHTPGAPGQIEKTSSEDEPHRVVHEVFRPVIQEIREVIQPYRRVVQKVNPVREEIHTVVAKGEPRLRGAYAPAEVEAEYGGAIGSIANAGEGLALGGPGGELLIGDGGYGGHGGGYVGGAGLSAKGLKGGYRRAARRAARKAARKAA